jgi:hypothetical protein
MAPALQNHCQQRAKQAPGRVHKAADTMMKGPGGHRVSIAGPTAGEDVGAVSGAGAKHQYANDTTGESLFDTIPGAKSTGHAQREPGKSDFDTVHDATTTGPTTGHVHRGTRA